MPTAGTRSAISFARLSTSSSWDLTWTCLGTRAAYLSPDLESLVFALSESFQYDAYQSGVQMDESLLSNDAGWVDGRLLS